MYKPSAATQQMLDSLTEKNRKGFAIGGGNFYGSNLGTREGFSNYTGARGAARKKGTTINNLFNEDPTLEKNISKEYEKGSGADRIIRDLNLKNKVSPKALQDYINEKLSTGKFKIRKPNKIPDTLRQPGEESRKFMDYIENIIKQNPNKKNMFQNLEASDVVKNSGANINTDNATRILSKIYNLATKGSKLEKFYPNIEKRTIELIDSGMGTPDITNTLIEEGLIERQIDTSNKTSYRATKNYFQRLIDSNKTKIKKLTAQPGDIVDITTRNYRDAAIKNVLDNQSSSITSNRISTIVSEELGEKVSPGYVKSFFKRKNIDIDKYIKTTAQRIFPEVKALDKIVKKNIKYLTDPNATFIDKGQFLSDEYTKVMGKNKAQTITANEAGLRLKKLLAIYAGTDQRYSADLYNQIKPLKNYTNPFIQKNLIGLTSNLSRSSNIDVAKMLGLPKKDIELLQNLQKATSQLGNFKIAGDHTDIKAIMSDFPKYKKNFMKIQYISNDLNTFKSTYDKKIIALYNSAKAGAAPETIMPKLEEIQNDFKTKTGYDIGGFSFKKNGKIAIDPQTAAINEYRYPINDNVIETMGNIEAYENKKYTNVLDKEVMGAKGSPNKIKSIYEKYKGNKKVINNSKYVKALDNIPKLKGFKKALLYGGAGAGVILTTAANADTNGDMFMPVDPGVIVPQKKPKEGTTEGGSAAAAGSSVLLGKYAKPFLKGILKTVASLPAAGTFAYMDIKQGMNEGQSFIDAATDPTVGLELLYPELFKNAGPLMARAARLSTPVGTGITVGGTLKNRAKEMMKQAEGITSLDEGEEQRRLIEEYAAKNYKGYNQGGRVNFADGPEDPKKRKFMKIMGGLASIPLLGRFIDIGTIAQKAAPVVAETVKSVPPYFFRLVEKIKFMGDDVTDVAATSDREVVKSYKDFEMRENMSTGEIIIRKRNEGVFYDQDGIISDEYMTYKPGTADEATKMRTVDEYEEFTVRPDDEGKLRDSEDGLDSIDEILKEAGDTDSMTLKN